MVERAVNFISSVRFGVSLLCLLVVLSMIGMLIVQQNVNGFDAYYTSLTPAEKTVYSALGFFDIYHSWISFSCWSIVELSLASSTISLRMAYV